MIKREAISVEQYKTMEATFTRKQLLDFIRRFCMNRGEGGRPVKGKEKEKV